MKLRSSAWVVVGALLCLALPAAAIAGDGRTDTVPPVDLPEVPRMVAFELFAPPASGGG